MQENTPEEQTAKDLASPAEAMFRRILISVALLREEEIPPGSIDRLMRALLSIGCLLHFAKDKKLLKSLENAEFWIDTLDLTSENPATGEPGIFLPQNNTLKLQHSIVHWLPILNHSSDHNSRKSIENLLSSTSYGFKNELLNRSLYQIVQEAALRDQIWLKQHGSEELLTLPLSRFLDVNDDETLHRQLWGVLKESEVHYWHEWLQGFLDGTPLDWDLQRRIALIDDDIWNAGPQAVAKEIERIKAEFLAEKLPMAETIELNPETGKFRAVPLEVAKPSLLAATLTRVEDTLEDVLASPSNGLHERSREVRDLRRAMTKYGNDPQQIEMGFVCAYKSLTRQILNDDLPPSEENLALQDALQEGARGIRATHPDVAENRKILAEQAIRELPETAAEQLREALPELVAISDPELAEDWQHDIPQLINDATLPLPSGAPALPGANEATRIFSRAAKISLLLKASEVVHKIDGSAGYKGARIVLTVAGLVTLGLALL